MKSGYRKTRRAKSVEIRGSNVIYDRVPFRRISIELPENVWAKAKIQAAETGTPISRQLIEVFVEKYGVCSESEILGLYQLMAGFTPEPVIQAQTTVYTTADNQGLKPLTTGNQSLKRATKLLTKNRCPF